MRKILVGILAASVLGMLVAPTIVSAQMPEERPSECCKLVNDIKNIDEKCAKNSIVGPRVGADCKEGSIGATTSAWAMCCTVDIVYKVTNWIFFIMLTISVLMVIAGGVFYMTAAGNTEKTGTGKNLILYAIVGLAIGILAKIIPSIVTFII